MDELWFSRQFHILFFQGTSTFDAWLNASSFQLSQVLLTLPYSFAQLGFASGIAYELVYALMGCWSCYMTTSLYIIYRKSRNISSDHSIQWYEVLDGLLGWRWKFAGLIFNTGYQLLTCVIFIAGCSSLAYSLDNRLNKRTWTIVLVGCFLSTVFIPKAQHYRIWSSIGVVATTYTAWYLTIASIFQGKIQNVKYTAPNSTVQYFVGATNMLYAFGGHAVTVEIVGAMRQPESFKKAYLYSVLYILTLTLPSAITVYWAFGERMLRNPYAFAVFEDSKYRDTGIVLMLIHQFMQFGFLSLPLFMKWEKLLGVHRSSNYYIKSASRIPVVLVIWFLAVMIPFVGLIDSVVGATCTSFSVYVIPCAAHMMFHRKFTSRLNSLQQPPYWTNWTGMFCLNLTVILWVVIVGIGLGGWSGLIVLMDKIHTFGIFPKCYQCKLG